MITGSWSPGSSWVRPGRVFVLIESHQHGSQVRPTRIRELGQSSKSEALIEALSGGEAQENDSVHSGGHKSPNMPYANGSSAKVVAIMRRATAYSSRASSRTTQFTWCRVPEGAAFVQRSLTRWCPVVLSDSGCNSSRMAEQIATRSVRGREPSLKSSRSECPIPSGSYGCR